MVLGARSAQSTSVICARTEPITDLTCRHQMDLLELLKTQVEESKTDRPWRQCHDLTLAGQFAEPAWSCSTRERLFLTDRLARCAQCRARPVLRMNLRVVDVDGRRRRGAGSFVIATNSFGRVRLNECPTRALSC